MTYFYVGQVTTLLAMFFFFTMIFEKIEKKKNRDIKKRTGVAPEENQKRKLIDSLYSLILATVFTPLIPVETVIGATEFNHRLSAETAPWLLVALATIWVIKMFAPEKTLVEALTKKEASEESDNAVLNQLSEEGAIEPENDRESKPKKPSIAKRLLSKISRPYAFISAIVASIIVPICSCAIIPIAKVLRKEGLPKRETALFTVLTPEMDAGAFYMRGAIMGWPFAIATLISSLFTALFAAFGVEYADKKYAGKEVYSEDDGSCKDIHKHTSLNWYWAMRYAVIEILDDLAIIIFICLIASGYMSFCLDASTLASFGLSEGLVTMIVLVIIGIPIYVCASESTPLGAGLLAAGFSPGAVAAFFIAGPATNATTFAFARGMLGKYCSYFFFAIIAASAVGFGLLTDSVFEFFNIEVKKITPDSAGVSWFGNLTLATIMIASIYAVFTTRVLNKGWDHGLEEK